MDAKRLLALFWLLALAYGRKTNDEPVQRNGTRKLAPTSKPTAAEAAVAEASGDGKEMSARSYGFKDSALSNSDVDSAIDYGEEPEDNGELMTEQETPESHEMNMEEPMQHMEEPMDHHMDEPMDHHMEEPKPTPHPDIRSVKKVKEVSIISLKPHERNKALDPITEQMRSPIRIIRPLREVGGTTILVRNRHHPILIARRVPANWIHRHHHHHHHPHHHKPKHPHHHKPKKPKKKHHKCKPCKKKPKKKHHHKPKKPKKKHKKGHCKHPKKHHHKKLIYYAPVPTAMNYYYGSRVPQNIVQPSNNYAVEESQEHEDVEEDTEKPIPQEIEDEVDEEHRLAELAGMGEPFDEPPDETIIKSSEVTEDR